MTTNKQNEYFLLNYEVVNNYVEARTPYRQEHLQLAKEFVAKGYLVLGGALEDPSDGARLVFYAPNSQIAEDFAGRDPYVKAGIVTRWTVRKWKVVVGTACENPLV